MRKGVFAEAVIVGGSLVAASYLIMYAARKTGVSEKVPFPAWIFFAGAATHLAWESAGGQRSLLSKLSVS